MKKNSFLYIVFSLCLFILNISLVQAEDYEPCSLNVDIGGSTSNYEISFSDIATACTFDFSGSSSYYSVSDSSINASMTMDAVRIYNVEKLNDGDTVTFKITSNTKNVYRLVTVNISRNKASETTYDDTCTIDLDINESSDANVSYSALEHSYIAKKCGLPAANTCHFGTASGISNVDNGSSSYVIHDITNVSVGSSMQFNVTCNDGTKKTVTVNVKSNNTPEQYEKKYGNDTVTITDSTTIDVDSKADCDTILGSTDNPDDVAYVLNKILKFMQILGPILVIVLSIVDLIKVVTSADKDAMSKFLKTTVKRLIYAVLLFIFPTILDAVLKLINVYGTCGIG